MNCQFEVKNKFFSLVQAYALLETNLIPKLRLLSIHFPYLSTHIIQRLHWLMVDSVASAFLHLTEAA